MGKPVVPGEFNEDLRHLPKQAPKQAPNFGPPIDVNPRPQRSAPPASFPPPVPKPDPLLQSPESTSIEPPATHHPRPTPSSFDTPRFNFDGQSNDSVSNPDTIGDVGPRHYIQMINASGGTTFQIFNKKGGILVNETLLGTLAPHGSRCQNGTGDPIVLYDPLANRWLMSEIAERVDGQPNFLCVYISKSRNPVSGGWWTYEFETLGFPDYPHYAVWPDAYYVGVNEVDGPDGDVASAYALDRKRMLRGQPATFNRFKTDQLPGFAGFNELTPADLDGRPPRKRAPAYFVRQVDDEFHFGANTSKDYLEIWAFHADFDVPANATFTRLPNVRVADFDSRICDNGPDFCITQPDTNQTLDSLPQMTLWRVQYRRFGSIEMLVGNFTVDATGQDQAGIRWFVLSKAARSHRRASSQWMVTQQGTYAPDEANRWMGSIAMDGCGNLALGYSVSSETVFPGVRYAGRLLFDPRGELPRGENSIIEGESSYTISNRWGDYSSMNVDPADDSTFWYTNQYMDADGQWQTRIASFKFRNCK